VKEKPVVRKKESSRVHYTVSQVRRNAGVYLFFVPAALVCVVFFYVPMAGLVMAFQDYKVAKGWLGSPLVGLKHFTAFLQSPYFYLSLRNTLAINGLNILIGFPLPIILALVLNSLDTGPFKRVTQTISYMPHFISWVVIGGLAYRLLDHEAGAVNLLLSALGGEKRAFMRQPESFWGIITCISIWKELGWNTIIYIAALSSIDVELYEAAMIDGANGFKRMASITLPGIAPVIALMFIFTIGNLFNAGGNVSFDAIFNMRNALVSDFSDTIDYFIYQEGIAKNRVSFASAVGFAQSIVSFIVVMAANALSRKVRGYGAF
jgi:putative aldouronate transport system permease protein